MSDVRTVDIDALRLHPDAERVPMPDAGDLRVIRESLQEDGQQDPVDATEDGVILDGRTRWTLLREQGARSIQVRTVHVPADQQTHYIVTRALTRRHLTMAQKRVLNDLLRVQVIEERRPVKSGREYGEPMRIGYGQTERAEKLGVDTNTVQNWDREAGYQSLGNDDAPTHAIDKRGRPQPIHKERTVRVRAATARELGRPAPLRKSRPIPYWSRQFSTWCRSARPEDRDFLRRLDREIHAALNRTGIPCSKEEAL